jgi:epoxyqueuosine reductase
MPQNRSSHLKQAIQRQAERLGFQLFGVTSPDPPPHIEVYRSWLEVSYHGEMGYLATERVIQRRADPRLILPECRSILVLGIRYPSSFGIITTGPTIPAPTKPSSPALTSHQILALSSTQASSLAGRVASYAWGADYHDVLAGRLSALVDFIEEQAGASLAHRCYTDTGPLLERDLAQRAGLGWIGKNTCLIHPRQGSYFFLAEILLGIDLEPDAPFTSDYCGDCRRCQEVCPTGCILPNRTIDSRRCISYLTIELKGIIPLELRHRIGYWVFGCDLCQQVCPWNVRFSRLRGDPAFDPRPGVPLPELLQELSLSSQDFNRKFRGSPIKRTRRRGYLRNVAIALGNEGDPAAVPALNQAITGEPEPLVRGHVAWALGRIGGRAALRALDAAALTEKDAYVLQEIHHALANLAG